MTGSAADHGDGMSLVKNKPRPPTMIEREKLLFQDVSD
jgi:hypothetical protein